MDLSITLNGVPRGCHNCGIVVINPHGELTCVNSLASELLSIHPELPAPRSVLPSAVLDVLDRPSTVLSNASTEVRVPCPDEEERVIDLNVSRLDFGQGQHGLLVIVQAMSVDDPQEVKLRHFERLARLGVLSASMAHELRNSMVAVSTMTDLLIEQHKENELAETVRRELDRANSIAVRMLNYSRPGTHSRKPVSTHEVLGRALQLANPRFKESGASVTQSLLADPDLISADEAHLEQMFLNLLINAADAIDSSGEVNLSTEIVQEEAVGRAVRIAVRDTGSGIPTENLPNLFQPFFTTKRHGTGLGLYLAQRIVEEHSGCINVDSTPGQGTCVQVYLPVHPN